jgi:hypothetical protein
MVPYSKIALLICALFIIYFGVLFYPRWDKPTTEATIGWDVSGYYSYLPAVFIYSDLKKAAFLDTIIEKYQPTPGNIQGYNHPSGNFVFKYPMGQALQFLPWFVIGHTAAAFTNFPQDGFSWPYQAALGGGDFCRPFGTLVKQTGIMYVFL